MPVTPSAKLCWFVIVFFFKCIVFFVDSCIDVRCLLGRCLVCLFLFFLLLSLWWCCSAYLSCLLLLLPPSFSCWVLILRLLVFCVSLDLLLVVGNAHPPLFPCCLLCHHHRRPNPRCRHHGCLCRLELIKVLTHHICDNFMTPTLGCHGNKQGRTKNRLLVFVKSCRVSSCQK